MVHPCASHHPHLRRNRLFRIHETVTDPSRGAHSRATWCAAIPTKQATVQHWQRLLLSWVFQPGCWCRLLWTYILVSDCAASLLQRLALVREYSPGIALCVREQGTNLLIGRLIKVPVEVAHSREWVGRCYADDFIDFALEFMA
jgi:hypothetical protein